uniref:Uncharacterized protein n=1 Tax=Colobus angolensis palliatus TaxID=336983 RepID=A0A2K5I1C3_COLAP
MNGWKTLPQQQRRDAPSEIFLCRKSFLTSEKTLVLPGKTQRHL